MSNDVSRREFMRAAGAFWPVGSDVEETELYAQVVPPRWFVVTGVVPEIGRPFTAADGEGVVVVSHWLWRRLYGRRTTLAGAHVTLSERSRRPSGLRKTRSDVNSLAHRTTWLRSDLSSS